MCRSRLIPVLALFSLLLVLLGASLGAWFASRAVAAINPAPPIENPVTPTPTCTPGWSIAPDNTPGNWSVNFNAVSAIDASNV